ncbi:hypothetical protein [Botrimarina sp.]|uniref:hypothetical protein n=1 Tax=Botrimarina sp. TaxID=2795802 RepID=UPI0032EF7F4F
MSRTLNRSCCLLAALLAATCFGSNASASVVAWGAAQNTTGASNVSTNGSLVAAFNGGGANTTANGVLFTSSNVLGTSFVGALNGGTTGDAGFDTLLNSFTFGGGTSTTIDLGSFLVGALYEVQVFFADQRTPSIDRVMTYGSNDGLAGPTVNLEADSNNAPTSPFGQYAIGQFLADGADPDLTLATNGFANAHINAWQVRLLREPVGVIPEASAGLIWSVLSLGACLKSRRAA